MSRGPQQKGAGRRAAAQTRAAPAADQALRVVNGARRVRGGLVLGRLADEALRVGESDPGRRNAVALVVGCATRRRASATCGSNARRPAAASRRRPRRSSASRRKVPECQRNAPMISTLPFLYTPTHEYVVPKSMPITVPSFSSSDEAEASSASSAHRAAHRARVSPSTPTCRGARFARTAEAPEARHRAAQRREARASAGGAVRSVKPSVKPMASSYWLKLSVGNSAPAVPPALASPRRACSDTPSAPPVRRCRVGSARSRELCSALAAAALSAGRTRASSACARA